MWKYVILAAFLQRRWLHERASILRYGYIACLVCYPFVPFTLSKFNLLLLLLWHYSPGWALASFKSFRQSSRLWAVLFQFLHPALAASSATWSCHLNLGLPPGWDVSTFLAESLSFRRITYLALLSLLSFINLTTSSSLKSSQSSLLVLQYQLPPLYLGPSLNLTIL